MVERNNGYLETSFLPGRTFSGPADFNEQLTTWLPRANARVVRGFGRPVDAFPTDRAAMIALPPVAPVTGMRTRVRLARDYYVRMDSVDYSVDPRVIGRLVDVEASLGRVRVTCAGQVVADHERCWADRVTVTDPKHVAIAKQLRAAYAADRAARDQPRTHADGQVVQLRALPDYDRLYGLDSLDGVDGVAWVTGTVDEP